VADKKKEGMSTISTILVFGVLIGVCIWLVLVLSTQGERRLDQACKPLEYTTQFVHELATTITGRQPTWSLYVQRYLMSGCYYGFSIIFTETLEQNPLSGVPTTLDGDTTPGGIQ